jgi:hypothetical protein
MRRPQGSRTMTGPALPRGVGSGRDAGLLAAPDRRSWFRVGQDTGHGRRMAPLRNGQPVVWEEITVRTLAS